MPHHSVKSKRSLKAQIAGKKSRDPLSQQLESKKVLTERFMQDKDDTEKHMESLHADLNNERSTVRSLTKQLTEKHRPVNDLQVRAL